MEVVKQLEQDIKVLEGKIKKCQSLSMMRYYYNDMMQLISLLSTCELEQGMSVKIPKLLGDFSDKKNVWYENRQFDNNHKHREITKTLALGSICSYSDAKYEFFNSDYKPEKFSNKDARDIIMDFYTRYNPELYKWLKAFFDEKRIVLRKNIGDDYAGVCFFAPTLAKSYVLTTGENNKLTIAQMSYLAHELGHALHCKFLNTRYEQSFSSMYSNHLEFPSCTFEKMFLDFASRQNIDKIGAELEIKETYDELLYQLVCLIIINSIKDYDIDDDYYLDANTEDLKKAYNDLKEIINFEVNDECPIQYRNTYIYGLGNLLGAHFSNMYLEDPKEARKQIENIICNIGIMDDFELLDNFSLNKQSIYEGKQLCKSLTRNQNSLKKMNI